MSDTEGQRIVREIVGKRLTAHDRVALATRIDGLIKILVGAERHRCFDEVLASLGRIQGIAAPPTQEPPDGKKTPRHDLDTFWIENPDGDEERVEFFVGKKSVASFNHDEHGWQGMRDASQLFENVAKAVGAKLNRR